MIHKVVIIWLCLFSSTELLAHPFHTSLTEIEYNADGLVLEVAVKLNPFDLEEALTVFSGRKIVLDDSNDSDLIILAYLQEKLTIYSIGSQVCNKSKRLSAHWVGKQLDINEIWLYLTFPTPDQQFELDNQLLFTLNEQQINTISVIRQGKRYSNHLTHKKSSMTMNFKITPE